MARCVRCSSILSARTAAAGSSGCARNTRVNGPPSHTVPVIGVVRHQNTSASPSLPSTAPGGNCQLAIQASGMASPSVADSSASAAVPGPRSLAISRTISWPSTSVATVRPEAHSSTALAVRVSIRISRLGCSDHAVSSNALSATMIPRDCCANTGAAATAVATVSGTAQGSRNRDLRCVANIQNTNCARSIAPSARPMDRMCRTRRRPIMSTTIATLPIQNATLHCGSHGSASGAAPKPCRNPASTRARRRAPIPISAAAVCPAAKRVICSSVHHPLPDEMSGTRNGNVHDPVAA